MAATVLTRRKIPAATNRAHLEQRDPRCDTVVVLNMAKRHPAGKRYADMNACPGADNDWNLHWVDNMRKNKFTHIKDAKTGHIRECTHEEATKPVLEIHTAEMRRYRKKVAGRWVAPATVFQRQRQAHQRGVIICWEIKSRMYKLAKYAQRFAKELLRSNWPAYVMTLVGMADFGPKLKAFKQAGVQTALLGHGTKMTATKIKQLQTYHGYIDRQWGAFHGGKHIGDYVKAA